MATAQLENDLQALVDGLSVLRIATPNSDPDYLAIEKYYLAASDLLEASLEKAIDAADEEYVAFSEQLTKALEVIDKAKKKIDKISKVIAITAQVVDIAGKILSKV
jgi:hypothetical protein